MLNLSATLADCSHFPLYSMATSTSLRDNLSKADHYEVCKSLKVLNTEQLIELGTALGLDFANLKKMKDLPGDMVHAWLNGMDYVLKKSGSPSWTCLIKALDSVGQGGVASTIRKGKILYQGQGLFNL